SSALLPLPAALMLAACSGQTQHSTCTGCDPYSPFQDAAAAAQTGTGSGSMGGGSGGTGSTGTPDGDGGAGPSLPGAPAPAGDGGGASAEASSAVETPPPSAYDVAKKYAGAYAVQIRFRKVVTVGTLGTFNALATIVGDAQITDDAANQKLTLAANPCHIDLSGKGTGLLNGATLLIPDIVMTTTKLDPVPFGAVSSGGTVSWSVPEVHGPIGWKWMSPSDTMPMSASDSRVFDQDMDGHPGVTMNLPWNNSNTGAYFVQTQRDVLKGTVDSSGNLTGTTVDTSSFYVIGSDNTLLTGVVVTWSADSNTADDTVRLVKVPSALTCQDVVAQASTLFP
ncbi:MAG TPA: hypothetical protein VKU41_19095, partial [Polyangiaceae bacterium]|nr:hypothetical protein [Polyangiaceae bacterium]